jgi:hypothetical protein
MAIACRHRASGRPSLSSLGKKNMYNLYMSLHWRSVLIPTSIAVSKTFHSNIALTASVPCTSA